MPIHSYVPDQLESWAALQVELDSILRTGTERSTRVAPAISGWSALHHVAHVTLANELVLRNLKSLAKGSGLLVIVDAEQNPEALAVLERGQLTRGRAQSPRMVVPPKDIDLAAAAQWLAQFQTDLASFAASFDAATAPRCFIPHQVLGPLDLAQWARFGVVHTQHHLAIARDVLAAP
jgi:hypothetical protein